MSENKPDIDDGGPAFPSACVGHFAAGMTLRAYAAINLRMPYSGIDWLDKMIWMAKRDEFAGQALAGVLDDFKIGCRGDKAMRDMADDCYSLADAMMKARAQ